MAHIRQAAKKKKIPVTAACHKLSNTHHTFVARRVYFWCHAPCFQMGDPLHFNGVVRELTLNFEDTTRRVGMVIKIFPHKETAEKTGTTQRYGG